MKVKYIAIEREYGSAGTEIATRVAQKCGVGCYGKEIIDEVSKRLNLPTEDLEKCEQNMSNSFLYSMFLMSQSQNGNPDLITNETKLFVAESKVIKDFVHNGPAIFIGHCASHVLKDMDGVVKVFIHANNDFKLKRAIENYGIEPENAESICKKFDKKRANYYAFCTQKKWNDLKNYDLVIDSSKIGIDNCVDILASLY